MTVLANGRWRYFLVSAPVIYTVLYTLFAGTFAARNCTPFSILPLIPERSDTSGACRSIPFTADLPGMTLAFTSTVASIIYFKLHDHYREFDLKLSELKIADATQLALVSVEPPSKIGRFFYALHSRPVISGAVLLIIIGGAGFWLYVRTADPGYMFQDFESIQRGANQLSADGFEQAWWANRELHLGAAAGWLAIGVTGFFFAVKALSLNIFFSKRIQRLSNASFTLKPAPMHLEFDGGWRVFSRSADLSLWGALLAIGSFAAVIYLAREPSPLGLANITLGFIAIFALSSAAQANFAYFSRVRRMQELSKAEALRHIGAKSDNVRKELEALPDDGTTLFSSEKSNYLLLLNEEVRLLQERFVFPKSSMVVNITRTFLFIAGFAGFLSAVIPLFFSGE